MMKRLLGLAVLAGLVLGAGAALASTTVKMSGDVRIHANFWSQYQYTGWNYNGTQTADSAVIWQRVRIKTDFVANEDLKFRLGVRINDKTWGNDTFRVDNPAVSIDVYQAFLQFKWPGTDVSFMAGLQDMDLPLSTDWLGTNVVLGGTRSAAATVEIPFNDNFTTVVGYTRLLDTNAQFAPTTTWQADELDAFFLALPISLDGFKASPWAMLAIAGRDADYAGTPLANAPSTNESLGANLLSATSFATATTFKNPKNVYWWAGSSLAVTALDPFKFYADFVYGSGNENDRSANRRRGLFFNVAAEYAGFEMLTPQVTFWYSTGEDNSVSNGSERLPAVVNSWGPTNSLLFNTNQELAFASMGTNPIGSWGVVVGLDKITFVKDLTHRLAFTYARGTNSAQGLRVANALSGVGNYVMMGRDLTQNESLLAVNFDHQYDIYENLAAIVETGWSHGDFQTSVWGHRFTNAARNGDAWKVAFGLKYKF